MNKVLIIKGADFSGNKIATIEYGEIEDTPLFTKTRVLSGQWPSIYNPATGSNPDAKCAGFPLKVAAGTYKFKVTFPTNSGKVLRMNIQSSGGANATSVFPDTECDGATREYIVVVPPERDNLADRLTIAGTSDGNIGGNIYIEGYLRNLTPING